MAKLEFNQEMRNLMNTAWMLVKYYGFALKEAMKHAWALFKLVKAMRNGIVKFAYRKMDGTTRIAWGSLKKEIMPELSTSRKRTSNPSVQVYFDTVKQEFRCFKIANLICE